LNCPREESFNFAETSAVSREEPNVESNHMTKALKIVFWIVAFALQVLLLGTTASGACPPRPTAKPFYLVTLGDSVKQ